MYSKKKKQLISFFFFLSESVLLKHANLDMDIYFLYFQKQALC